MLLTGGVGRCGKCGCRIRARGIGKKGQRRYGCPPEGNHGYGCGGVTRTADVVDAYVTEAILSRLEKSDIGPLVDTDADVAALTDDLDRVNEKLAELAAAWAADSLTRAEWQAARAGLDIRRQRLERDLERARRSSAAAAIAGPSVRVAWDRLDLDARRAIIRELLPGGAILHPIGRGRWRNFDPKSVELRWFDA
jgi:hypothetical protein